MFEPSLTGKNKWSSNESSSRSFSRMFACQNIMSDQPLCDGCSEMFKGKLNLKLKKHPPCRSLSIYYGRLWSRRSSNPNTLSKSLCLLCRRIWQLLQRDGHTETLPESLLVYRTVYGYFEKPNGHFDGVFQALVFDHGLVPVMSPKLRAKRARNDKQLLTAIKLWLINTASIDRKGQST